MTQELTDFDKAVIALDNAIRWSNLRRDIARTQPATQHPPNGKQARRRLAETTNVMTASGRVVVRPAYRGENGALGWLP